MELERRKKSHLQGNGVDNMYKIGEFSKIVDIPVRTLRYYAEYGVLVPSEIDPFTGYKYYSDENIVECESIKLLKSIDFTLEEIIQYKDSIDSEAIAKKKKEMEERMYLLKRKYERILLIEQQLNHENEDQQVIESPEEKILRRKYEKRIIRKND